MFTYKGKVSHSTLNLLSVRDLMYFRYQNNSVDNFFSVLNMKTDSSVIVMYLVPNKTVT